MTLIWNIIQSVITILEIRVCVWMMEKFAEPRYSGKKQKIVVWIVTLGVGVAYAVNRWMTSYYSRVVILSIVLALCLLTIWVFKYHRKITFFITVNYMLVDGLFDLVFMSMAELISNDSGAFVHILNEVDGVRIVVMIFSKSFLFIVCKIIQISIDKNVIYQLSGKGIGLICIILCLIEYVAIHTLTDILNVHSGITEDFWFRSVSYLIVIALMLVIMGMAILYYDKKTQLKLQNMYSESLDYEHQRMIRLYRERETMYHDFKNHLLMLDSFLYLDNIEQLREYMESIREPFIQKPIQWKTGHDIIDLILNYKIQEAKNQNIPVKCEIYGYIDFGLKLTNAEVCALFGNLWDNAIESNLKLEGEKKVD